jgi:hypothetical protein
MIRTRYIVSALIGAVGIYGAIWVSYQNGGKKDER